MYEPKLGPYNAMALGIASELAEFLLLEARAQGLGCRVCRLVVIVARHHARLASAEVDQFILHFLESEAKVSASASILKIRHRNLRRCRPSDRF